MIAPFLLCVFAACFSKFVYGKLYNPSTVFFLIWMLLLAFSRLGLFGVPVPNSDTYLLLFIGLFSFFVGFVSVDLKKWFGRKNIFFRKFESDVKYSYVLNFKIVIVLYSIREARQMGYDTIWCCAHPNNTPSVCSIESTGYKFADQFVVDGWPRNVYYRSTSIQR